VFHLNDSGLSLMMATAGAGAFVGALTLAYMGDFRRKAAAVLVGGFFFGACLMAFSLSTVLWLSLVFLFLMGFSIVSSIAVINTLLQSLVTDRMRGRVMSMFILSFVGIMPFGNLIAGSVSHTFGAPNTLASGGLIISIFMLSLFLFNKRIRS
jgi:MFS family permease